MFHAILAAACQAIAVEATPTTTHELVLTEQRLPYHADLTTLALSAEDAAIATISGTAYWVEAEGSTERPIVFAFNGGPGASSSPLHFSGVGPVRRERGEDGSRRMVPNETTLLPYADLIFVDPVGTGLSRQTGDQSASPWWGVDGDVSAMRQFIEAWLTCHEREDAAIYLMGESYGGYRAALLADDLDDLSLRGVILVSPALDFGMGGGGAANILPSLFALPSMAVISQFHGITSFNDTPADLFDEVAEFAMREFAPLLLLGGDPFDRELRKTARQLEAYLGMPLDEAGPGGGRLDPETYREALLKEKGLVAGRLDGRVTAPIPTNVPSDRPSAANDPALGLGQSNVILAEDIAQYLSHILGIPVTDDYVSLSLDVNFAWDWSDREGSIFNMSSVSDLKTGFEEHQNFQLLVVGGYYDMATPVLSVRYVLDQSDLPQNQVHYAFLPTGHSVFGDVADARLLLQKIQNLFAEGAIN